MTREITNMILEDIDDENSNDEYIVNIPLEKSTKEISNLDNDCPVCLEDLGNDYITMDCCTKLIHIKCINDWYSKKLVNNSNDKYLCIMCRSESEIVKDIVLGLELEQRNSEIFENRNNNIDNNINIQGPNNNQNKRLCNYFLCICSSIAIFYSACILCSGINNNNSNSTVPTTSNNHYD